ncbi:MAG TPA: AI-2E family transporter [Bacillota bacterium]|nr:AI-2E family transporter [Bacillota bacterium]HPF42705.1 AI-2E family transporter [Bacillota bacterium]HPJ86314.1 AI-2E family transporter [Bacillota bacterium]HPQ62329.1 AI-2E family transporter [Bacillota bacterium]HRX92084.1 AI-2E family transporter [Candidatus Izemoplasmatales bacterium]
MKKKPISDELLNRIIKYLAIALLTLAVIFMATLFSDVWNWIFKAIKTVVVPVVFAYFLALIMHPLLKYLEKKGVGPRWLSLAIVFLLMIAIIAAFFYFIIPAVVREITAFFNDDFQKIIGYLTSAELRDNFILGSDIYDKIFNYVAGTDILNTWLDSLIPTFLAGMTDTLIPILTAVAIIPIMLLYYLLDYEMIGDRLRSIIPQKHEKRVADLGSRLNQTVGAYLRGQLILMAAIGAVATIVYKLIGLKYYFAFGLLVGITNIIPYFGSIIAAIPPIAYAAISGVAPGPLIVLAVNIGLQFVEGNIFQPIIMAKQLEMHPLVIIISILFFGALFGTFGVVFASPIAAAIRVFYNFFREQKQLNELSPEGGGGKTKT